MPVPKSVLERKEERGGRTVLRHGNIFLMVFSLLFPPFSLLSPLSSLHLKK
jgi:hypothetical protein